MDEYIERETAKKEFNLNFGSVSHAVIANRILDAIPAADVAPVVRCKDCKWSAYRKSPFGVQTFTCQLLCADIKPDDFCSYGERKDGDGNES